MRKLDKFRGYRNIMNYDEAMDPEVTSNQFLEDEVKANFKVMEKEDVAFELILNPHQYQAAADVLDTVPNLRVVINHRGFPATHEQLLSDEYWNGMKRFAANPNAYMKVSFFARSDPNGNWENGAVIIEKSIDLIKLFTPQRCMFATNFPVDNSEVFGKWTMPRMIEVMKSIAKNFTQAEQDCLWRETALKFYRMDISGGECKP